MVYRDIRPAAVLSPYIGVYQVFGKSDSDDPVFSRDLLMPETGPSLAFHLRGSWGFDRMVNRGLRGEHIKDRVMVSAGLYENVAVTFPGTTFTVFVRFKAGGPEAFRLFSAVDAAGVASLQDPWAYELLDTLSGLYGESAFGLSELERTASVLDGFFLRRLGDLAPSGKGEGSWRVIPAMNAALCGAAKDQSLRGIADTCGMCERTFERTFLSMTGYSPRSYRMLTSCDLARSALFLHEQIPLAALSESLGFYDQSHFTSAFRRWSGVTPGEYQSMCRVFRHRMQGENRMIHCHSVRLEDALWHL